MAVLLVSDFSAAEQAHWLALLRAALPDETLLTPAPLARDPSAAPHGIDVALVANPPPGALQGLPGLRLIQSLWAGVDRLLADASLPADVPLARMVDPAMSEAMAETALWAVLSLQRDHFVYARQQRAQQWRPHAQRRPDDLAVAVLGLGEIGRAVTRRLASNGYRVSGWSRHAGRHAESLPGVHTVSGDAALATLLAGAQIVINLLPLTPATRGLFDAQRLSAMPRGACLVNLARGAHVVEADLLAALDSGQVAHAVLDVFGTEPLPAGHAFWSHPHVTLLPHVAAQTDARSAVAVVAHNVRALRAGQPLAHLVDRTRGY